MIEEIVLVIASVAYGFCVGMGVCCFINGHRGSGIINLALSLINLPHIITYFLK